MATYYVRISGNDSNAGTSAGAAWRTLSKAFTTVSAGDQVYIGAGTYREALTISTAWGSETKFTGDYTGQYTGDAGIVYWNSKTNGDRARGGTRPLSSSGTPRFWTFENIVIGPGSTFLESVSATIRDVTFRRCVFPACGGSGVLLNATVDATSNITFDSCILFCPLSIIFPTSASADYDSGTRITNSILFRGTSFTASGASAFKGGGIIINGGLLMGGTQTPANFSTTYKLEIYNSFFHLPSGTAINANTSGQITENYNVILATTARSNVTAGANSSSEMPNISLLGGYEWLYGLPARPLWMPMLGSPFTYMGGTSVPSTDILGRTRTGNGAQWIDSGTATAGGTNTLTDSGKTWGINALIGDMLLIVSGTGSGQRKIVKSNTATAITVFENWETQPSTDSVYRIIQGPQAFTAKCTTGASTTQITAAGSAWDTNQWAGYTLEITSGTGSGQVKTISSNSGSAIVPSTNFSPAPDTTSVYSVYRQTGLDALLPSVGCFEPQWIGQRETTTVNTAGGSSLRITGPGIHEFEMPVDASSTTVTVKARYDSRHGTTNKPQMQIVGGAECGVSDDTQTMTSAADTWETLTTTFTPTSKGIVTVRLVSRSDNPDGNAFFDDV